MSKLSIGDLFNSIGTLEKMGDRVIFTSKTKLSTNFTTKIDNIENVDIERLYSSYYAVRIICKDDSIYFIKSIDGKKGANKVITRFIEQGIIEKSLNNEVKLPRYKSRLELPKWARVVIGITIVMLFINLLSKGDNATTTTSTSSSLPLNGSDKIKRDCLSSRDGSHNNVEKAIKQSMNDPSSYEYVSTEFLYNSPSNVLVHTEVRGKNGFGAKILKSYRFTTNESCEVISLVKEE